MASNLPAAVNIGQVNACLVRVARLASDCSPLGGADSAYISYGLVTMTASPDIEEGTVYEPKNACGQIMYTYETADLLKRYNLSGEFIFFDPEALFTLFGGSVIVGDAGSGFSGDHIGWAAPHYSDPPTNGVYLEVITQNIGEGAGDCAADTGGFPTYTGHIFGKAKLTVGDRAFEEDYARLAFTGKATGNPNLFDGPFNDWPGTGYVPNSPYVMVGYSTAQYQAMLALAAPGWQSSSAAS
jgi:hypothetical protein